MSDKDLSKYPHHVNDRFWWFEEKRGICVCSEAWDPEGGKEVVINYIPWNSIRAALKRKDKKP